jgi:D-glucosaminate-6-phosphate ammonia-lyase
MSVYARLGVRTVINARGDATLAGGTLMAPEVVDAMASAARSFVRIADLQDAAGRLIGEATGAEAGYVTAGAAAGLTLGTAAILAGLDPDRMDSLPRTDGRDGILVQASHRNGYDHLVRAAGARLVEVGGPDGATPAELEAAIDETVAGAFFQGDNERLGMSLDAFITSAHTHGLPVLVDASMNLPPRSNLRRFIEAGADLVAFSGGKTIRGPQPSGILAGRRDLIRSVALQHQDMDVLPETWSHRTLLDAGLARIPQHGIGRSMKAGKEEIVGLIVALERYLARDEAAETDRWLALADALSTGLSAIPGIEAHTEAESPTGRPVPASMAHVDRAVFGCSAFDIVRALAERDPIVLVGDHRANEGVLRFDPENLTEPEVEAVVAAVAALAAARPAPARP